MPAPTIESVQFFGNKKTAVVVTYWKKERALIKINGGPIKLVEPKILRFKAYKPILLIRSRYLVGVDMRICIKGGGYIIYVICQSIVKVLVTYYQKYVDKHTKKEIKDILVMYDRTLLVDDGEGKQHQN